MAMTRAALVATTLLASAVPANAAGAPERSQPRTEEGVAEAAALVARADAALRAGRQGEAWNFYTRAWSLDLASPAPARGICRMALALRQQAKAEEACKRALLLGRTPEDMRNRVASWLVGPALPTMADLINASFMADGSVRVAAQEPWGYLARADLAWWVGDRELLDTAIADLRRVAPDHEDARRVSARATAPEPVPVGIWIARAAVMALFLATAGHAFARSRWPRRGSAANGATSTRGAAVVAAVLLAPVVLASMLEGVANAQLEPPPPPPVVDDAHPETSFQAVETGGNPLAVGELLMELADRGQKATARGDYGAAARYWTALTKAVPDRTYGWARLCDALDARGDREQAIVACRTAVTRQGTTVGDYTHFVRLLLAHDAPLTASERRQVSVSIAQVSKEPQAALEAERLRCDLAEHERDVPALRDCSAKLVAAAPDDLRTIGAQWALALHTGDRVAAERFVTRVRAGGRNGKIVNAMEEAMRLLPRVPTTRRSRAVRWGSYAAGAFLLLVAAGMGGAKAARFWRRRRGLSSPSPARPLANV
jgi:tetratricopeptide (TPR) repeat protein